MGKREKDKEELMKAAQKAQQELSEAIEKIQD